MICLHRHWAEGGDRPLGRWCTDCGQRVVQRHGRTEQVVDRKARERRYAQQCTAAMSDLAKQRTT